MKSSAQSDEPLVEKNSEAPSSNNLTQLISSKQVPPLIFPKKNIYMDQQGIKTPTSQASGSERSIKTTPRQLHQQLPKNFEQIDEAAEENSLNSNEPNKQQTVNLDS